MKIIKTKNYKIAQSLEPISEPIPEAEGSPPIDNNPLNGKTNVQARRIAKKIIPDISGFFRDEGWGGIRKIWDAFSAAGLNWTRSSGEHTNNEIGVPYRKKWTVEIYFTNNKGRPTTLYGTVVASGGGPQEDPFSKYDIIAYIN